MFIMFVDGAEAPSTNIMDMVSPYARLVLHCGNLHDTLAFVHHLCVIPTSQLGVGIVGLLAGLEPRHLGAAGCSQGEELEEIPGEVASSTGRFTGESPRVPVASRVSG